MYFQALNNTQEKQSQAIIWAEVSWVYYHHREFQKSIEAAENVLIENKNYKALDDLYRVQGFAYLGLKNYSLAERYLQLSLQHNSTDDKQQYVKFELGKLYFIQGNYDLAFPHFNEIHSHFEKENQEYFLSVLFYQGFIYYYLNNSEKSRECFSTILKKTQIPIRQASAKYGLAYLEFHEKNFLNVITLCEEVVSLDPKFFDMESVGFLTAASYYYLGRKDIFTEYYSKMKETYPQGRYIKELDRLIGESAK